MAQETDYTNKPEGAGWHLWWAWHPVVVSQGVIPLRWLVTVWRRDVSRKNFECIAARARPETAEEWWNRQW